MCLTEFLLIYLFQFKTKEKLINHKLTKVFMFNDVCMYAYSKTIASL